MGHFTTDKIALGLITRRLNDPTPVLRFLNNARQHGHRVDRVIVAYSHGVNEKVVEALQHEVRVGVVRAHDDANLRKRLLNVGLDPDEVNGLLDVPSWACHNEVPYGAYRNAVLVKALVSSMDYLLFFDTDVQPRVLTAYTNGQATWQDADFIGGHLDCLTQPDVAATSSDYSGYYIIPAMRFDGLESLLVGLRKDPALDYLAACDVHGCLNLGPERPGKPTPTHKVLGGNLGLSLDAPWRLAPFFSTTYTIEGQCILGRGEDTLLGQATFRAEGLALDVDLRLFHDTYDDFPRVPDIRRQDVRDRFHRACLGWIGRNPFLTWHEVRTGRLDLDLDAAIDRQRRGLAVGGPKAARFLDDARFESLPAALDAALAVLPDMIERYERLMAGWAAFIDALAPEIVPHVSTDEDGQVPLVA